MGWWHTLKRRLFGTSPTYDGVGGGRRAVAWQVGNPGAVAALAFTQNELRAKSRDLARRNAWAATGIEAFVANAIGTGIKPQSMVTDAAVREAIHALWWDWVEEADAAGLTDFYGLQALACRAMLEGGEVLVRLRWRRPEDGLPVGLQLQVLEPEHLPTTLNRDLPSGHVIRAGIEFDRLGRRVAYHLTRSHPGDGSLAPMSGTGGMETVRVPADEVIHLFRPLRPGQIRGEPWLARALAALHARVQHPWTTESLAREALLSRSAFAERFTRVLGMPPMTYLTRWRMYVAARRLRESAVPIGRIAAEVGYESESTFSRAFAREMGLAPGTFRRGGGPPGRAVLHSPSQ
jgi:lambda family phage portal protein